MFNQEFNAPDTDTKKLGSAGPKTAFRKRPLGEGALKEILTGKLNCDPISSPENGPSFGPPEIAPEYKKNAILEVEGGPEQIELEAYRTRHRAVREVHLETIANLGGASRHADQMQHEKSGTTMACSLDKTTSECQEEKNA